MEAKRYIDEVVAWACERLAEVTAGHAGATSGLALDGGGTLPIAQLGRRFGLEERERWVVELALAVEVSLAAARAARRLSGASGLTVEVVREALGGDVDELLAAEGALRGHALVVVDVPPGGPPSATAGVRLGSGLGPWLAGRSTRAPQLGVGCAWVAPPPERPRIPEALALLVRDDLVDVTARWVAVGNRQAGDAAALGGALAFRLGRPVLLVEGRTLGAMDFGARWDLASALRRESDLRDAALLIDDAVALGPAWQALGVRPAPGRVLPAPVVLLDDGAVHEGRPHPAFSVRQVSFTPRPVAPPGMAAAAAAPVASPVASPAQAGEDPFEAVRRQAARDAARAMGRPIEVSREHLPSRAVMPRALGDMGAPATPPGELAPASAPPPRTPAPVSSEDCAAPAATLAQAAGPESALPTPPSAAAVAPEANAPSQSAPPQPPPADATPPEPARASALETTGVSPPEPVGTAPQETAGGSSPEPAPASASAASSAPPAPGSPAPDASEALPYIEVPEEATLADVLRLIPLANNPLQRAELLRRLHAAKGNTQAAAMLRAHTRSEHEAIRTAAEEGMALFFGPHWNRSRPIPKPVQPPRSDDGGRGPHGAF